MKYILAIFISFLITYPVLAAKPVNGTVPELRPLQPAPSGIYPNYSGNINYIGKPEDLNKQEEDVKEQTETPVPTMAANSLTPHSKVFWLFGPRAEGETTGKAVKNFVFLIVILLAAFGGVYYLRKK